VCKIKKHGFAKTIFVISCVAIPVMTEAYIGQKNVMTRIKEGIRSGKIAFMLTEPGEITALLGEPEKETERKSGGMQIIEWDYPDLRIIFGKMRNDPAPFTLRGIRFQDKPIDIGQNEKLTLRTNDDLRKIDRFWGLSNISLRNLDLREKRDFLDSMSFDSLTEWPPKEKLPEGFNPKGLLENAKKPGIGIRSLHESGIDGRGVGIAIIDQPLLLGHKEYTSRLVRYDAG
jgi:hypothetical protein